jgi:hypothetical protein
LEDATLKVKIDQRNWQLAKYEALEREITTLLNKLGFDVITGTPDFILADLLSACLANYHVAISKRQDWINGCGEPQLRAVNVGEVQKTRPRT